MDAWQTSNVGPSCLMALQISSPRGSPPSTRRCSTLPKAAPSPSAMLGMPSYLQHAVSLASTIY